MMDNPACYCGEKGDETCTSILKYLSLPEKAVFSAIVEWENSFPLAFPPLLPPISQKKKEKQK
jgi:hypothetical protein